MTGPVIFVYPNIAMTIAITKSVPAQDKIDSLLVFFINLLSFPGINPSPENSNVLGGIDLKK